MTFREFLTEGLTDDLAKAEQRSDKIREKINKKIEKLQSIIPNQNWKDMIAALSNYDGRVSKAVRQWDYDEYLKDSGDSDEAERIQEFVDMLDDDVREWQDIYDNY